jgi:hypothetical protein
MDAGRGPEVDQHDLAVHALRCERRRMEPSVRAGEGRQGAFDGQSHCVRGLVLHGAFFIGACGPSAVSNF